MKARSRFILFFIFICICFSFVGISLVFAQAPQAVSVTEPASNEANNDAIAEADAPKVQEAVPEPAAQAPVKDSGKKAEKPAPEEVIPYVGVEKCKLCHPSEYQDQKKRKHAKSWKILEMRGEENNAECVKCHATGANKPGGFVSAQETPYLTGKQCEACHGPGGAHIKNPSDPKTQAQLRVYGKDKNVCLECHLCMTTHRTVEF